MPSWFDRHMTDVFSRNGVDQLGQGYYIRAKANMGPYCCPHCMEEAELPGDMDEVDSSIHLLNASAAGGSNPGSDPAPGQGRGYFRRGDGGILMEYLSPLGCPGKPVFNDGSHVIEEVSEVATLHLHAVFDINPRAFFEYVSKDDNLTKVERS